MNHQTKEQLVAFEARIRSLWEAGELPFLIHLCGGNEEELIELFAGIAEGDWVFSSHRSHYHYLLAGGDPERLEKLIRTGSSMFVFDWERNFFTSSVLAGTCCIAAGVAMALKAEGSRSRVWCFLGDGAEEEGHFYEAVRFVHGHDLPCTFIVEDNDRSVDTNRLIRRGALDAKRGIAWPACCVKRYHYTPVFPHAGSGCAHKITFNPEVKPTP